MNQRGYLLLEVLVASVLFSMAGSGLYMGYLQGVKAERTVRTSSKTYDPLRSAWMRMEQDLRNTVTLRDYRFIGKQDEMVFPVLVTETDGKSSKLFKLLLIRYVIDQGTLLRSEEELSGGLTRKEIKKRALLKNAKDLSFSYSFLDEKEKIVYEKFWLEQPYFGIPRAVKFQIQAGDSPGFSKLIAIPQGRWGHLQVKETKEANHES